MVKRAREWITNHRPDLTTLALGALATAGLAWRSPLDGADPMGRTLAVLPSVLALLGVSSRSIARSSSRRHRGSPALAVAALLWLFAVLARPLVSAAGSERVLIGGLYLLMAGYLWQQIGGLRRSLGRRAPLTPGWHFFLLPLALYLALLPWSTEQRPPDGDEPWYLLIAHSLTHDGDVDLANNYENGDSLAFVDRAIEPQLNDPRGPAGEIYSRHPILLPLLVAPGYWLAGKDGALAIMALITAALAWLTLRLAHHYWPERPGEALIAWGLLSFAPPLLFYSHQLWVGVPAALLLAFIVDRIQLLKSRSARTHDWLLLAAAMMLLVLLKLRFGLLAAPVVLLALIDLEKYRRALGVLAGGVSAAAVGLLLLNRQMFGNALVVNSWRELLLYRFALFDYASNLLGLLFDVAFGLFPAAPIWALLLPASILLVRQRSVILRDLVVIGGPYVLVVASRPEWYGGWSPPFRYPLVLLPFLALCLVPLLRTRHAPGPRMVLAALLAATVTLSLLWIAVPGWTYNFANGRSHLVDHLASQIGGDVARLFPSSSRPRIATWLWPPMLFAVLGACWWIRPAKLRMSPLSSSLLGVTLLLLGCAAVPYAARHVKTRRIEIESAYVSKTGGHPDPQPWVVNRRRFPEAWVLREGDRMTAPVNPGDGFLVLFVEGRFIRNHPADLQLVVRCGERILGVLEYLEGDHDLTQRRELGPFEWVAGSQLSLSIPAPGPDTPPGVLNGVVLDRVDLRWNSLQR